MAMLEIRDLNVYYGGIHALKGISLEVEEGQTIGLLEAMKMLNPIEADRAGRLLSIGAENGALVTRGDALFRLAPDGSS